MAAIKPAFPSLRSAAARPATPRTSSQRRAIQVSAKARKQPHRRTDSDLTPYFRDMAELDVLAPEQEFTTAREIEALEIALWEVLLGFSPAADAVLRAIELTSAEVAKRPELRALSRAAAEASRRARPATERFARAAARAARTVRALDADHLFVDQVLITVSRLRQGIGVRGGTLERAAAAKGFAAWHDRVAAADRAARAARSAFVEANLRLVVSIARRFNHGRMPLADLIQEGNLGLMKAVERYDYRRGFRFSTYASWWIRHAISRALADKGREIRLPVHMIDAHHRLTKARRQLTARLGREPTTEELAQTTQMTADKVEKMRTWIVEQSLSIDRPFGDEEGRTLGEVLEDPNRETTFTEELEHEGMATEIVALLGELRPIEADILRQRFGLGSEQELTLKQIGDKYQLSRERIRQLQEQALIKMRRALARRDLY